MKNINLHISLFHYRKVGKILTVRIFGFPVIIKVGRACCICGCTFWKKERAEA
jgi:hypothetical protein